MATAVKILHPSIHTPASHGPSSLFTSPSKSRRSDDSCAFSTLRLHRLLETVLTERPSTAPILEHLLTTLRDGG